MEDTNEQHGPIALRSLQADFSLRASGSTYIERSDEATRIRNRIENSSSCVVGIAGVRGAGKSSLSKRVLDDCDAAGYFMLLIPSPTGYEPREFLIAIFQRIAEHCSDRVGEIIEGTETLTSRGFKKAQELHRRYWLFIAGVVVAFTVGGVYAMRNYGQTMAEQRLTRIKSYLSQDSARLDRDNSRIKELETEIHPPRPGSEKSPDLVEKIQEQNMLLAEQKHLQEHLALLKDDLNHAGAPEFLLTTGVISLGVASMLTLLVYPALIIAAITAVRMRRRYKRFRANPRHVGLYIVCRDFLELITYETTLSSGKELGASYSFLSGKLSSKKELSDRPLSLPGLTATCSALLSNIAEVFKDKIVICIDELDKITDIAQLTELLKGIKGILGQECTYFLLSISEDAMSHFSARLSSERNLIESSFEDVVYLDRVDRNTAAAIIERSLTNENQTDEFRRNSLLLWVFGAGVPREIKRLVFSCSSSGVDLFHTSPVEVWKSIYLGILNNMLTTTSPLAHSTDSAKQYKLLVCAEELVELVGQITDPPEFGSVLRAVVTAIDSHMHEILQPQLGPLASQGELDTSAERRAMALEQNPNIGVYQALLVEVLIGAVALGLATGEIVDTSKTEHLDALIYAYKYIPINPQYAHFALEQFCKRFGRLDVSLGSRVAA